MQYIRHNIYTFIRHHFGVCVLVLIIGIVSVAPQIYAMYYMPSYAGVTLMGTDAESHYVARIQEVYDGYPAIGNTFLPNKNIPSLEPALGEDIVAYFGMALHISSVQMDVFGKFFFPLLIALFFYTLLYIISKRRVIALLGVLFAMFGNTLMSGPRALFELARGIVPTTNFLLYARPINPEISALFLFGSLIMMYWIFFRKRKELHGPILILSLIVLGITIGLSLYVSIYAYTFLIVFWALFLLYKLIKKEYSASWTLGLTGAVALLSAIPFIINYIQASSLPAYADASLRFGLIMSHTPVMSLWVLLLAIGAFFLPRQEKPARTFFLFVAFALAVVLNQQIVTGHVMQSSHYHWYITKPLVGLMLGWYVVLFTENLFHRVWIRYAVYGAVALVLFYNATLIQITSYRVAMPALSATQEYAPVLSYLHNQPTKEVVWANRSLSLYIPLYTQDDAPNNGYAQYYLVSNKYFITRLLLEYKLRGVTPNQIASVMYKDRANIAQRIFGVYWRNKEGSYSSLPDSIIKSYASIYKTLYKEPFVNIFKQLEVTEVVWNSVKYPSWNLNTISALHKITTLGDFSIYRL